PRNRRVQTCSGRIGGPRDHMRLGDPQCFGKIAFRECGSRRRGRIAHRCPVQSTSDDRTLITTLVQSPREVCRNKRAVGYHRDSLPVVCQRQSGANASNIQVGRASAPLKCALLVSTEMTRSIAATSAAVPSKSLRASSVANRLASAIALISSSPSPFCNENQSIPSISNNG